MEGHWRRILAPTEDRPHRTHARLVHFVSSLQVGGAEKCVCNLACAQQAAGEDVSVISFGEHTDPFQQVLVDAGVSVINIRGSLWSRWSQLRCLNSFDVLHIHSPAVIRALAPVALRLWHKQVVYTIHGETSPPQKLMKSSHQLMKPFLDVVTAVSADAAQTVRARYGWQPDQVFLIPNGIQLPALSLPSPVKPPRVQLGVVSRLVPLKNLSLLFTAIDLLTPQQQDQLELQVFGDGPCRARLESESAARPTLRCTFHGNVTDEVGIFGSFDILVMCSDTEGLPMSIIEAMGYAKPVIATAVGAIPDAVDDGRSGWLYPPREAARLADILTNILAEPEVISRRGEVAREKVERDYSIEAVCDRFLALYHCVAPAPRVP